MELYRQAEIAGLLYNRHRSDVIFRNTDLLYIELNILCSLLEIVMPSTAVLEKVNL